MPRCNDCNIFVGLENEDPELNLDCTDTTISGTVTINLNCAECSQTIRTAEVEVDIDLTEHFDNIEGTDEFEITSEDAEPTDWYEGRKGAPQRYQKHFWGADVTLQVQRTNEAGDTDDCEITTQVGEQASSFDEY